MKVKELIELLQKEDQEKEVICHFDDSTYDINTVLESPDPYDDDENNLVVIIK